MRKLIATISFSLMLIAGAAGAAPAAHAEGPQAGLKVNGEYCTADAQCLSGSCKSDPGDELKTCQDQTPPPPTDTAAANTPTYMNTGPAIDNGLVQVMNSIMSLFAWLLGVAAVTLDTAVHYTVVTMGSYISNLTAVGVTWRILRDIGNILFIFGFLAIGVTTILNVNWYGGGTKMLPKLLLGAIFLNFSLFFTEAIIDTGNLFATQFYTQINGGNPSGSKPLDFDIVTTASNEGISTKLMNQIGLAKIYDKARSEGGALKSGTSLFIGFMGILVFLVAAFVLFSLAFVLIARFVILIFLIILAPIGFAGFAIPQLNKIATMWRDKLIQQTITAPILLLLLYIALAVITDAKFLSFGSNNDWTGFIELTGGKTNITGFAGMMLSFLVAMGLLLAVVMVSKSLSAFGANKASALAGKLSFGVTAFGMRSTVGATSQYFARKVRSTSLGATKTGRILATTLDRGAKASFDVRGVSLGGGLKSIGVDAGEAQKGGYAERQKKSIEAHEKYAASLTGREKARTQNTAEEKRALSEAETQRTAAAFNQKEAKDRQEEAKSQRDLLKAEVDRLQEEKKRDRYWETNPDNERKLNQAQQGLAASEANISEAVNKLANADEELAKANAMKADVEKAIQAKKDAEVGASGAKERRIQYANNIDRSLPGWALFGPGGSLAAKKIRTAKPTNVQLAELYKKMMQEESSETKDKAAAAPAEKGAPHK